MTATAPDGRTQRRQRTSAAVVDALLDLYREGNLTPGSDEIAERAGVSPRSLFRYFEDIDALVAVAIASQQERIAPLMAVEVDPDLPFEERLARFVAARLDLYEGMGHVARVARAAAQRHAQVGTELTRIRAVLRGQLETAFARELDERPPAERAEVLAAADVATAWEAVDLLRHDQGLGRDAAARVVARALRAVLR